MKLTDIDLSSLAEVAAAVTLLEHVHRELATGGTPLPELVVNPAPSTDDATRFGCAGSPFGFPTPSDAEKLRGMGVDPITAQPLATGDAVVIQGLGIGAIGEVVTSMDAATVFGGAPAQSAAPLPAPSIAGVAASPTAPAALQASGQTSQASALPALAPLPAPSAAAPAAPVAQPSHAGGVELDSDGLPWHPSIHAGTKRKNADGRWTAKKGINDPDLVPRVVAQLRAQMAAGGVTAQSAAPLAALAVPAHAGGAPGANPSTSPASAPAQSAAPFTSAPSTAPLAALPATSGPVSLAAPTPPALPVAPTPAAPQQYSAPAPTTFQDFMTALTVEVQAGRVPIAALTEACQPLGGVSALNTKPELIPVAWAALKAKYPGML